MLVRDQPHSVNVLAVCKPQRFIQFTSSTWATISGAGVSSAHQLRVVPGRCLSSLPRLAPSDVLHCSHSARSHDPSGGSLFESHGDASGSPSLVWPACHGRPCSLRVRLHRQHRASGLRLAQSVTSLRATRPRWSLCRSLIGSTLREREQSRHTPGDIAKIHRELVTGQGFVTTRTKRPGRLPGMRARNSWRRRLRRRSSTFI